MHISGPQLKELTEVVEDTIEYFCDQEQVSGELAWTVLECLATAKIAELKGELAAAWWYQLKIIFRVSRILSML